MGKGDSKAHLRAGGLTLMDDRKVVTFTITQAGSACIRTGPQGGGTDERVFALPGRAADVGRKWAGFAGGRDIARMIFPFLAGFCGDFLEAAREVMRAAEVVVFDG